MASEVLEAAQYGHNFIGKNFIASVSKINDVLVPYKADIFSNAGISEALGDPRFEYSNAPSNYLAIERVLSRLSNDTQVPLQQAFLEYVKSKPELRVLLRAPPEPARQPARAATIFERAAAADALGQQYLRELKYEVAAESFGLASATWTAAQQARKATESYARSLEADARMHEEAQHFERASKGMSLAAEQWQVLMTPSAEADPAARGKAERMHSELDQASRALRTAGANEAEKTASRLSASSDLDQLAASIYHWQEVARHWRELGGKVGERQAVGAEAGAAAALAAIDEARGRLHMAAKSYLHAADLFRQSGRPSEAKHRRAMGLDVESQFTVQQGDLDKGQQQRDHATRVWRSLPYPKSTKESEARAADIAARIAYRDGQMEEVATQGSLQIRRWLAAGRPEEAKRARTWFQGLGVPVEEG